MSNEQLKRADSKSNDYCAILNDTSTKQTHHIYLCNEIAEPRYYVDVFNVLKNAGKDDEVYVYLNTPGGYLSTTIQIISAIKMCKAKVTCVLDGEACSAGAMIFLSGHDQQVNYGSYLMAHWYSTIEIGKGQEIKSSVDFHDAHFKKMFREIYEKFLTEKEMVRLFAGEDFWFDAEEVILRLLIRAGKVNEILDSAKPKKKKKHEDKEK